MGSKQPFDYERRKWARRQAIANMAIEGIYYPPDELALIEQADREGRSHDEITASIYNLQSARHNPQARR